MRYQTVRLCRSRVIIFSLLSCGWIHWERVGCNDFLYRTLLRLNTSGHCSFNNFIVNLFSIMVANCFYEKEFTIGL